MQLHIGASPEEEKRFRVHRNIISGAWWVSKLSFDDYFPRGVYITTYRYLH